MSVNIRFPNITALTEKEQIAQIRSYLHQLVEQLNWALPNLGSGDGSTKAGDANSVDATYYELRSMVITKIQEIENMVDAIEAAFWRAERVTFVGSTIPALIISQ